MRRHARVERLGLYKRRLFHSANVVDNFVMGERLPDQWLLRSRQFMKSASGRLDKSTRAFGNSDV